MDKKRALDTVEGMSKIVLAVHRKTDAPVVIVLCMSSLKDGSVLSSCYGPKNATELATALRFAADYTDHADAIHIDQRIREPS